jgi:hypothetical protein
MTREKFWKKWGPSDEKGLFLIDLNELIVKHQAPYISALDNISCEIDNLTTVEVQHAEVSAKRLG